MEKQNITLSIPKDVLRRAKIVAIKRNDSLSGMLTGLLIELVEREDRYEEAMRRGLAGLNETRELGGDYAWSRESLHER
jgi:hypothetical protein